MSGLHNCKTRLTLHSHQLLRDVRGVFYIPRVRVFIFIAFWLWKIHAIQRLKVDNSGLCGRCGLCGHVHNVHIVHKVHYCPLRPLSIVGSRVIFQSQNTIKMNTLTPGWNPGLFTSIPTGCKMAKLLAEHMPPSFIYAMRGDNFRRRP